MTDDKIIDLQDVRVGREIDADQERWEEARVRLFTLMGEANLSYAGLTSVFLRALLDMLTTEMDMTLPDAKQYVATRLKGFF